MIGLKGNIILFLIIRNCQGIAISLEGPVCYRIPVLLFNIFIAESLFSYIMIMASAVNSCLGKNTRESVV